MESSSKTITPGNCKFDVKLDWEDLLTEKICNLEQQIR